MDDAAMAAVAMDDGGSIAILVFGVLAAYAVIRLVPRHYFPPDTWQAARALIPWGRPAAP